VREVFDLLCDGRAEWAFFLQDSELELAPLSVSFPTQSLHRGGKHGIYIYERTLWSLFRVVPELVDPYCERHPPSALLTTVERILTVKAFATHSIPLIKYLKIVDGMPSED
jgi:hypothetical protein